MRWLCLCACVCALLALCEAACPPSCICNITRIDCFSHKVPQDIPLDTTFLNLRANNITQVAAESFKDLNHLTHLYLNNNKIKELLPDIFKGLESLNILNLADNQLTILENGVFRDLSALRMLFLQNNQLTSLGSGVFHGLTALTYLALSDNNIVELPPDIFKHLNLLETLWLSNNKIKELPLDIFKGLANLNILMLYDNQLTIIENGVFRDLSSLRELFLKNNSIKELPPDIFKDLQRLKVLLLQHNQLTSLESGVFHGLTALTHLYLSNNKIKELPPDIFIFNLKILCLDHNPLVCDCTMKPTKKFLEDKSSYCERTICQFPSNLAGKYLEDIPDDNFNCSKPYFLQTPQDTNSNVGDTVILNCSAAGLPQPDISWSKDNSQVQSGGEIQITNSGSLIISNSVRHYAGTYRCTATNSEGNISALAQFKVYKMCPALESDSLSLQCKYGLTKVVDCSKPMLPLTTVTFNCKPGHVEYPDLAKDGAYSKTLTCLQYKIWSSSLPKCKPACGRSKVDSIIHQKVIDGTETTPGEYPWHVGLYLVEKNRTEFKCGGSLISNKIVMTAAHCAVNYKVEDFRVALGKHYRSWTHEEPHTVRLNVSAIKLPGEYRGPHAAYLFDIALLVLSQEVQTDSFIMPVCRDASLAPQRSTSTTAHVVGWGITEEGTSSETLISTNLTLLGRDACQQRLSNIQAFDKLCGSKSSGSVVGFGDSGGGLTVVHNGLHYILGVVSVNYKVERLTTFTDIFWRTHDIWIEDNIKKI